MPVVRAALAVACVTFVVQVQAQPKQKIVTNSLGMKFIWIPSGSFLMGSPADEPLRDTSETLHKVTLTRGFFMGVHTVTQEQWEAVMGSNPSNHKGKTLPVDTVSWSDCQRFIKKLRERDNKPYRLPSEAEWEYACRARTKTPFYFGETIAAAQANFDGTFVYGEGRAGEYRKKTMPVGSFPANVWGLFDMHGNVWQWCQDRYADYPKKEAIDPQGADKGAFRVLRGGAWNNSPDYCRSAYRHWLLPDHRYIYLGCRVCFSE